MPSEFRRLVFPRPQASSVCLNVAMAMAWEFPNVTNFEYHWAPVDEAARLAFSAQKNASREHHGLDSHRSPLGHRS